MLSLGLSMSPPLSVPSCKSNSTLFPFGWISKFKPTTTNHLKSCPSNIIVHSTRSSSPSNFIENHDRHQGQGKEEEKTAERLELEQMSEGLQQQLMPKHVAYIMDGHRRWAKEKNLPVELGYSASRRPLKAITGLCCLLGIKVLSIFIISPLSFQRPQEQTDLAFDLVESAIKSELAEVARNGIRVSIIGNRSVIPKSLAEIITQAEETTKTNKRLHLIGVLDYTGRDDIIHACTALAEKVKDGVIQPKDIDESLFQQELQTKCSEYPNPDLLIRTGGRYRLANFLLWQLAYSEIYFVEKYAPDFKAADFIQALSTYQKRHRRFERNS